MVKKIALKTSHRINNLFSYLNAAPKVYHFVSLLQIAIAII
ncbi:hypothetical protein MuYL_4217 [Mucilaginibacter xinganensis]|uniref:Uncharacterized protein n=1 Tax=Mucilaginibacter xinganensis TaxID=1234841 RepID=A0A223P1W1_9SPHI|nr:hypothetical protein MuYL_4217 [Mucilaginibacter xinganensis]